MLYSFLASEKLSICNTGSCSFILLSLGQSLAQNAQTLFITRFLSGLFSAAPLSNGGGLIADIWGPDMRGHAMGLYTSSVFFGSTLGESIMICGRRFNTNQVNFLGPVMGGFVTQTTSWRWVVRIGFRKHLSQLITIFPRSSGCCSSLLWPAGPSVFYSCQRHLLLYFYPRRYGCIVLSCCYMILLIILHQAKRLRKE